ncbi:MAG TPA: cytochrome c oxidase subunit 3 [Burkholderiales bacterium]|jgi:heme/copper-type cytochrome/quinol oxidase subunit 3|nr:cytochrome c oxidase subunit 3 [Burkholderiales bacterium]
MMREMREGDQCVLDVSEIPSYGFGHRSLMWWGTLGMVAIEGTVFALAIVVYFYVRTRVNDWPPSVLPPELIWGTANTVLMLLSLVPNQWTKRAAEAEDLPKVRIGLAIGVLFGAVFLVLRAFEFTALNCRWDTNAYGSAVWMLLSLHTIHVATDFFDTAVLSALMAFGPIEGKRFVDVSENSFYWYFVVFAWIPIYAIIYFGARIL